MTTLIFNTPFVMIKLVQCYYKQLVWFGGFKRLLTSHTEHHKLINILLPFPVGSAAVERDPSVMLV